MGIGIERLIRRRVPQPGLHNLHRLTVSDQQARVVMPQLVNTRARRRAGCLDSGPPHIAKRATPHRCTGASGEDQTGRAGRVGGKMGRQRVNGNLRQRDRAH